MVFPGTAPKPFRPLAERVNARRCQLQDSEAELREDHLCSWQRALESLSSLPPQYLTPAISSLLAHQFSVSKLKVSHLRNTPLTGGLHHQLFLLPFKEKLQKGLTVLPHLHIFLPSSLRPIPGGPLGSSHLRVCSCQGQQCPPPCRTPRSVLTSVLS